MADPSSRAVIENRPNSYDAVLDPPRRPISLSLRKRPGWVQLCLSTVSLSQPICLRKERERAHINQQDHEEA